MPEQFKDIDSIMRGRLDEAQMEPSGDLWSSIEGQIDAPQTGADTTGAEVAKTGGKLAKVKLAGTIALIGTAVGIIGLVGIKKPKDPVESTTETPVLIPEQEVEMVAANGNEPSSIAFVEAEKEDNNTGSHKSLLPQAQDMDDPQDIAPISDPTPEITDQPDPVVAANEEKTETKTTNATPDPTATAEAAADAMEGLIRKPGDFVEFKVKIRNTSETEYANDIKILEHFSEYVDPQSVTNVTINHGRSVKYKFNKKTGEGEFSVDGAPLFPLNIASSEGQRELKLTYSVKVIKKGSLAKLKGKKKATLDYLSVE